MHFALTKLRLGSKLCNNSLELLVFSSHKILWWVSTIVLKPITRRSFKNLSHFSTCECLLSNATGNSNSQNDIYLRLQKIPVLGKWGKEVSFTFRNRLNDLLPLLLLFWTVERFYLVIITCVQAHSPFVLKYIICS